MARGIRQPAKKKHFNKPRLVAVTPLSDLEREFRAAEAKQKAKIHLEEAVAIAAWGKAPNAAIHSAYYAMHFCAVAALYRAGGVGKLKAVPESHEHVIKHYIQMAEAIDDEYLKDSGMELNRLRDDRMRADYFIAVDQEEGSGITGASPEEANEAANAAELFLEAWARR